MPRLMPVLVLSAGPALAHPGLHHTAADTSWMPVLLGVAAIAAALVLQSRRKPGSHR